MLVCLQKEDRKLILMSKLAEKEVDNVDFDKVAILTNGFTSSDLDHLARDVLNINLKTCVDSAIENIAGAGFAVSP